MDQKNFESIHLPHTWNNLDGQSGEDDYVRGKGYYQKKLTIPAHSGRIFIEFEGVNHFARVSINGVVVGEHSGGFSTFRFDITTKVVVGENLLEVVADNSENLPIYPQHADFTFFGGIYRSVSLIFVEETHFDLEEYGSSGIYITPTVEGEIANIALKTSISGERSGVSISFDILNEEGVIIANLDGGEVGEKVVTHSISLERPILWNGRKNAYLYTLVASLKRGGEVIDELSIPFGIRSFSVDPEKGFFLNGSSYPLRGVSKHQDRQDKGWATSPQDLEEDMSLIKEIGANTIRLAHYQHPQYFYNLCDKEGMVVWAEIPFITTFLPDGVDNTISQMRELVLQNYNHPSICFWGISNEITIGEELPELAENQKKLQTMVKDLDSNRYTTLANMTFVEMESGQNDIADLVAYNHYFGWYQGVMTDHEVWLDQFHEKFPTKPLCLSEYGVEAVLRYHSDTPQCKDYTEEYQTIFHQNMAEIFTTRPYLWGTYVWNMFDFAANERDEGGVRGRNNKGLVTFDRQIKKDSFYAYKAYWNEEERFVHLVGRRYRERPYEKVDLMVYSNQTWVKLSVNGVEIGEQSGEKVFSFVGVLLEKGENFIQATSQSATDEMTLVRVETPNPDYVLPVLDMEQEGVKNWFEEKESVPQELTFDPDYFSVKDKLKPVLDTPEGSALFEQLLISAGMTPNPKKMKMVHNVKIENIIKMAGSSIPEGSIYKINHQLQKIKK
ncbi:MAG: glycoside hydrolase family 2 TIM barrel-domain containing protein [Eubacteriales bacterium]